MSFFFSIKSFLFLCLAMGFDKTLYFCGNSHIEVYMCQLNVFLFPFYNINPFQNDKSNRRRSW